MRAKNKTKPVCLSLSLFFPLLLNRIGQPRITSFMVTVACQAGCREQHHFPLRRCDRKPNGHTWCFQGFSPGFESSLLLSYRHSYPCSSERSDPLWPCCRVVGPGGQVCAEDCATPSCTSLCWLGSPDLE